MSKELRDAKRVLENDVSINQNKTGWEGTETLAHPHAHTCTHTTIHQTATCTVRNL